MFTFAESNPPVLERNIRWGEAEEKYLENYMIVTNIYFDSEGMLGDIVAVLTPVEYSRLDFPDELVSKYGVWKGLGIRKRGFGVHKFYM